MEPILNCLKNEEILVADGAIGTILIHNGLQPGECPEALNLTKPEIIQEIAELYFDSGADIIQTNTFGASPLKLSEFGLENETEEINSKAVFFVKNTVNDRAYVSGSVGPSGRILLPYGDTEPDVIYNSFICQIKSIVGSGVDIVCIETMIDLRETILAIKATKVVSPNTPIIATMTFDKTPKGYHTIMGITIKEAAVELQKAGANILGSNCGNGIENMVEIAREFKQVTDLPIMIQSNAGLPETKNGELYYPESVDFFSENVPELIEAGVSIIGGCCGTTPEYIRAIRNIIDSKK